MGSYQVGQYVYYDIMPQDAKDYHKDYLKDLYTSALDHREQSNFIQGNSSQAQAILSMAQHEAAKELQLLNKIFNVQLNIKELKTSDDVKQLTEAINEVFYFKQVFERNRAMITSPDFKSNTKAVFSYYSSYLKKALKNHKDEILSKIQKKMSDDRTLELWEAGMQVLQPLVRKLQREALDYMFDQAGTELDSMDQKHQQAYREILQAIKRFRAQKNNMFLDKLYKIYRLDLLVDAFGDILQEEQGTYTRFNKRRTEKAFNKLKNKDLSNLGGEKEAAKSGYTFEALVDQCIAMVIDGIKRGTNTQVTSGTKAYTKQSFGQLNARPDNVLVFNASPKYLNDAIKKIDTDTQNFSRDRLKDAEYIQELTQQITSVQDGYIVYFNDKNYSIGGGWGHRAAENVPLSTVSSMLSGVIDNIDALTYDLLQVGDGAIGAKYLDQDTEAIAQGIAFFLFDDYSTIGTMNTKGQAIHILALEGMFIPLSAFLFAMGQAMEKYQRHVKAYAKATVKAPAILYGKGFDNPKGARFFRDSWEEQVDYAFKNTYIKVTFLENMQSFVRQYLT